MQTTIELLMALDRGKLAEVPTEKVRAKRLSKVAGQDVYVTVSAIAGDQYTSIASGAVSAKGREVDAARLYDMHALIVAEAMVEPDLKNAELQRHYGAATPRDLAKVLFPGGEIISIADVVTRLSGYGEQDEEHDVKNS